MLHPGIYEERNLDIKGFFMGIKSFFIKPSTEAFFKEADKLPWYTRFDRLHGYVYGRWTLLYIGIGTGQHPIAKMLAPVIGFFSR
jgi:hypothetical protein